MDVYWCGFNGFSQLTQDTENVSSSSFLLCPQQNVIAVDFSWHCAVTLTEHDVYISGWDGTDVLHMKKIETPEIGLKYTSVTCGSDKAYFIENEGTYWEYFYSTGKWRQLPDFANVEEIGGVSCSDGPTILVDSSESDNKKCSKKIITKICSGSIVNTALDSEGCIYSIPSAIPMPGIRAIDVSCGFEHCIMLDDVGRVYTWGSGMRGQLGNDVLETNEHPLEVLALGGLRVVKIAAGGWHSAAVTDCGDLYTWGWNNAGQLGFPMEEDLNEKTDNIPEEETGDSKDTVKTDGTELIDTEQNVHKTENINSNTDGKRHVEVDNVPLTKKFKDNETCEEQGTVLKSNNMSASDQDEYVMTVKNKEEDNEEAKFICNKEDNIDNIKNETYNPNDFVKVLATPRLVEFPHEEDVNIIDVSCGNRHTIVVLDDGGVWGCGWNAYGQLGRSSKIQDYMTRMCKLELPYDQIKKVHRVHCGGWNTVVFVERK